MRVVDFKNEFLYFDFDNVLLRNDVVVQSNQLYLLSKQRYLEETEQRVALFEQVTTELTALQEKQIQRISQTKVIYTFVDETKIYNLKQRQKKILTEQRVAFDNLMQYMTKLHATEDRYSMHKSNSIKSGKSSASKKSRKPKFGFLKKKR